MLDARKADFEVYVIREGVRAVGGEQAAEKVEEELKAAGAVVIDSKTTV